MTFPADSAIARADAHFRWAAFSGGFLLLFVGLTALRLWRGETIRGFESIWWLVLLLHFAAHLGSYHRLRRRQKASA